MTSLLPILVKPDGFKPIRMRFIEEAIYFLRTNYSSGTIYRYDDKVLLYKWRRMSPEGMGKAWNI